MLKWEQDKGTFIHFQTFKSNYKIFIKYILFIIMQYYGIFINLSFLVSYKINSFKFYLIYIQVIPYLNSFEYKWGVEGNLMKNIAFFEEN